MKHTLFLLALVFFLITSCDEFLTEDGRSSAEVRINWLNKNQIESENAIGDIVNLELALEFYNMPDMFTVEFKIHFDHTLFSPDSFNYQIDSSFFILKLTTNCCALNPSSYITFNLDLNNFKFDEEELIDFFNSFILKFLTGVLFGRTLVALHPANKISIKNVKYNLSLKVRIFICFQCFQIPCFLLLYYLDLYLNPMTLFHTLK